MSDIQLAVLLAAVAVMVWYVRGGLERESGHSGLLEPAPRPATPARDGVRWLLWGHAINLIASIPVLASSPWSLDEGHAMIQWLAHFLSQWLHWVGLTQAAYLIPLWRRLRGTGRALAARVAALCGGVTLSLSLWAWAIALQRRPGASFSLQAAAGLLVVISAVALYWLARELRRTLRSAS
ncbi:MAG TPA: hypothetical protein DEB40_11735 [Elusimicrobia bacterium]|nr:hypothetical protein [Elusimicrobiota bacterium]HBT62403.1 hypothetical protein [Elusimicrobiota bacterium]